MILGEEVTGLAHEAGDEGGWFAARLLFQRDDFRFGVLELRRAVAVHEFHNESRPVIVDHKLAVAIEVFGVEEFWEAHGVCSWLASSKIAFNE